MKSTKIKIIITFIVILCALASVLLGPLTIVLINRPETFNTSIFSTINKVGTQNDQIWWLGNISTGSKHWYKSLEAKFIDDSTDHDEIPIYVIPRDNLVVSQPSNDSCTEARLGIVKVPQYNVSELCNYLYAGLQFVYEVCASNPSVPIAVQAHLFQVSNSSDYDAYQKYLSNGVATSAVTSSNNISVDLSQEKCVQLNLTILRNGFYFVATSLSTKSTVSAYVTTMCWSVTQFRNFDQAIYSPACTVTSTHPCLVSLPESNNLIKSSIQSQDLVILANVARRQPSYTVLDDIQMILTPNKNIIWFTLLIELSCIILIVLFIILLICVWKYHCH